MTLSETVSDGAAGKYRRVYLTAAETAGREPWEYVEEAALREALAEIGFAELIDNGTLLKNRDWKVVDLSDDGEDPRRRYYYPSGNEPRPDEFRRFHELLTQTAPDDYEPHYFRVARCGKDPAIQFGSWKQRDASLSAEEAVEWMRDGGNIGLAGRGGCRGCGGRASPYCPQCEGEGCDDALVNVDIDDDEATTPDDVPTSLRARSRSRTGWHTWYFNTGERIPNIPTDDYGEVRTDWQYVVAPGSFVASVAEEIPDGAADAGYYTVEDEEPVARIGFDDLPDVFRDVAGAAEDSGGGADTGTTPPGLSGTAGTGDHNRPDSQAPEAPDSESAVFDVNAADLVTNSGSTDRFSSIFHGSTTGANMSVSERKLHCWRHLVAHGGLQALAVLSNQVPHGCEEIGKAHDPTNDNKRSSTAGPNRLKGDWRLVWAAWHEAKSRGEIPDDDPIPYRALRAVAIRDGLVDQEDLVERETDNGGSYMGFPAGVYSDALDHIRAEYGVNPGRERPTGGEDSSDYYAHDLEGLAAANGIDGNPYDDNTALLKTCLHARDELDLGDAKPPYAALVAVANMMGLSFDDAEDEILGENSYKVAKRMYDDLEPGSI